MGADPADVGRVVSRAFGDMACSYGFVHSDPHPGNMLIRQTPPGVSTAPWQVCCPLSPHCTSGPSRPPTPRQLVVLDHGMYRQLTPQFRRTYCKLWRAMVARDLPRLQEAAAELNAPDLGDILSLMFTYRVRARPGARDIPRNVARRAVHRRRAAAPRPDCRAGRQPWPADEQRGAEAPAGQVQGCDDG